MSVCNCRQNKKLVQVLREGSSNKSEKNSQFKNRNNYKVWRTSSCDRLGLSKMMKSFPYQLNGRPSFAHWKGDLLNGWNPIMSSQINDGESVQWVWNVSRKEDSEICGWSFFMDDNQNRRKCEQISVNNQNTVLPRNICVVLETCEPCLWKMKNTKLARNLYY